jgi:hypothetical protein
VGYSGLFDEFWEVLSLSSLRLVDESSKKLRNVKNAAYIYTVPSQNIKGVNMNPLKP